ncbi:hypothetical protein JKP88DRAFT_346396 [Tribonema minus]|uniref:Uncharacterized protein n=1 Tax=Tribonema minus TaxID=303371 RepID=A0A836CPR2_9STRA|nr:hypothetical protein JKP88DRAFT_346396 [Tribonema minus]
MALDDKGRMMRGRIEFFERNIHKLSKHLTTMVAQHKAGVDVGMKFSERVKDVAAQEPFADLQDRLVALSEVTERIALERKGALCDRAEQQVLAKLTEVQTRVIAPTKALLKDRDECIQSLVKAETEHDLKVQQGKATKDTPLAILELRHCLRNTEKVVDNNMELFEAQRVEDVKENIAVRNMEQVTGNSMELFEAQRMERMSRREILQEFVRCEMYYHCRALEMLAPALQHLSGVHGDVASDNIRHEMASLNTRLNYS